MGYGVFVVLCVVTAWLSRRKRRSVTGGSGPSAGLEHPPAVVPASGSPCRPALRSCCWRSPITSTQNVAAIPFLWVLPLSLYLLSFILCFESARMVPAQGLSWACSRWRWAAWLMRFAGVPEQSDQGDDSAFRRGPVYLLHGLPWRIGALKPHPQQLTSFYLMISVGGALGGVFVALIAPRVFTGFMSCRSVWRLRHRRAGGACAPIRRAAWVVRGCSPRRWGCVLRIGRGGLSRIRDPAARLATRA